MVSPVTPFTEFRPSFKPLTHTTPFTFTGYAFLEMYEELVQYLTNTLSSEVNENLDLIYEQTQTAVNGLAADITATKSQWQALFDQFMLDLIEELEGLNDQAMANLVKNSSSSTRVELEKLFASKTAVAELQTAVNNSLAEMQENIDETKDAIGEARSEAAKIPGIGWTLDTGIDLSDTPFIYHVYEVETQGFRPGIIEKKLMGDYIKNLPENSEVFPPQFPIVDHARESGASLVVNSSAWSTTPPNDGKMTGLFIKDGVWYQGFATTPKGRDALGVDKQGKFHILRGTRDTKPTITAKGITDTFVYGPPLVENGVRENLSPISAEWPDLNQKRPRTVLGQRKNGNIVIINITGDGVNRPGATPNACANLCMTMGIHNAILLDGGGSTQSFGNGVEIVRSSDSARRPLPETIAVHAPPLSANKGGVWDAIPLDTSTTGGTLGGSLKIKKENGRTLIRGSVTGVTAINKVVANIDATYRPDDWVYTTVPCVFGGLAIMATCVIKSNGDLQITRKDGESWLDTDRYDFNIDEVLT